MLSLLPCGIQNGQAGTHGALGVVLAGFAHTKYGEYVVTGVFQHLAAVLFDDGGELRECAVYHCAGCFWVEALTQ